MDRDELEIITELIRVNGSPALEDEKIQKAAEEAISTKTFSKMERLARMLKQHNDEKEFLLEATKIILEQA